MKGKNVFLHTCCGPCSIEPVTYLQKNHYEITAFFYNPNIHPFKEFERRVEAMRQIGSSLNFRLIFSPKGYSLDLWIEKVQKAIKEPSKRCRICYEIRLKETAMMARKMKFNLFSTTLLYSIYQDHNAIAEVAHQIANEIGINFLYCDFRNFWKNGQKRAREYGIYMQPYCGCIMSEQERYKKAIKRMNNSFTEEFNAQDVNLDNNGIK